jgi:hypothetical protein
MASGVSRSTTNCGTTELRVGRPVYDRRTKRLGDSHKKAVTQHPNLLAALECLVEDAIRGDPDSPLRWVSRRQRNIVMTLTGSWLGNCSANSNRSCQANRKTREGASKPDGDARFQHINATMKAAIADDQPAFPVDT